MTIKDTEDMIVNLNLIIQEKHSLEAQVEYLKEKLEQTEKELKEAREGTLMQFFELFDVASKRFAKKEDNKHAK